MGNSSSIYLKELMLDVSFYDLKETLVRKAGNHFDRNYCTKEFIHFDFMNDGVFSRYNLHRIKLFNVTAFKKDETNGKIVVRFKLYKAALFLYPLLFILLGIIPYFQDVVNIWEYLLITGFLTSMILLYLSRKFKSQYQHLQRELEYLLNKEEAQKV